MNTKLHAVTDTTGQPIRFFMTAGQVSDYTGARALVESLPAADWLLGDRGYDADWFREALVDMGLTPCILGRKSRDKPVKYDKRRYKRWNRIEIMFGRDLPPDTTDAQRYSCLQSPSLQPSCSGYETMSLEPRSGGGVDQKFVSCQDK
jgi:IS5 family transposase